MGELMILVRMKNGNLENLIDEVALGFLARGAADRVNIELKKEALTLKAESQGGVCACAGIELATLEPKRESAVVRFARTLRSR